LKAEPYESKTSGTKTELMPTMGSISPYNTAGLIWHFRRRSHWSRQKLPSSTTPLSFGLRRL